MGRLLRRGLLGAGSIRTKTTYGTRGLGLGLIIILRSTCALRALRRGPALAIRRVHGDYR